MQVQHTIKIIKADGEKELFDPVKLDESLRRSGASAPLRDKIVAHISGEIVNDMSTADIYAHALRLLKDAHKPLAARYSLRRALVGFGPTGFPFEDYIGEIYKTLGYTVEVGKIVRGKCVEHEVDLIAYNDDKLIMGEVKFHNELGLKTDLKVSLYVKARTDDLKETTFFYGGKQRKLTYGMIFTNTKFTQTAIRYSECVGMPMIGWNYPEKRGLEDLIESAGLHPLTCLTTINNSHKRELFDRGVVLCKSLKDDSSIIPSLNLHPDAERELAEEIKTLC
jgi:hypothetical protein